MHLDAHAAPLIIAHRGARGLVPFDNTMDAFEKAVELGAPMIEFDVRRCGDGTLVIFHDEGLGGEALAAMSYEALLEKTRAKGYEAPRLSDALRSLAGRVRFDIELKEAGYERELAEEVLAIIPAKDAVFKSFMDRAVRALKRSHPGLCVGLLVGSDGPRYSLARVQEVFPELRLGRCLADFVSPYHELLHLGFVRRMHAIGMPVYVWTVNDERRMRQLVKMGVDAIITDRPDLGLALV
jgi:glycerophosphoryl diester phosphodiesterase